MPTGVEESAPDRGNGARGVSSPEGMAEDIGDAVLEVLEVGAGFEAGNVAAHEDAAELRLGSGGSPLWVASNVKWIVLLPVEDGGAELGVKNGALDPEVDDVGRVGGGLLIGHAVEFLGRRGASAGEEVVDEAADEALVGIG